METFYVSCKKYTADKNSSARKTKLFNAFLKL